jgi:hypothetical protein
MVYDLSCGEVRLTITVAQRENGDGRGDWVAEAYAREATDKPVIAEPGPGREDALRAVAQAWAAKNRVHGFPELDWEAIAAALRGVRAI